MKTLFMCAACIVMLGVGKYSYAGDGDGSLFGIRLGPSINFNKIPDGGNKLSIGAGAMAGIWYKYQWKVFYIRPELMFSLKGNGEVKDSFSTKVADLGIHYTGSALPRGGYKLYYLDVPIMAGAHLGGFFAEVGPVVSFNLKAQQDYTFPDGTRSSTDLNAKRVDFGLMGGIGYKIGVGKFGVPIELQYGQSLTPYYAVNGKNSYNRYLSFTVGFEF